MLPIAGKTAGPNRRKLFVVTQGWPGVFKVVFQQFFNIFFKNFFFHRQRQALQLVLNIMIIILKKYF